MTNAPSLTRHYAEELDNIRAQGLFKSERIITSPQSAEITLADGRTVLNFCANNYLGLADHPDVIAAAKDALDTHGFGMASVRFICGTQDLHKQLEQAIADFFGTEDTILYAACFDANGGLFEPLLGEQDAIISDALNHASIIDGVRLCKARRYRYANCDMADLEKQLQQAKADGARTILITTDGVFSMDGFIAPLDEITALAAKYGALVHIDECHATGFLGATGRGSAEVKGVLDRIDIFTGTLGKAMGGALGGFTTARKEVIELLRQRSRPYLFSNSLPPHVVAAGIKAFEMLSAAGELRDALRGEHRLLPRAHDRRRLRHQAGRAPDQPGDAVRRPAGTALRASGCWRKASTRSASSSRWCRRARRASARRSRRRIPANTSTAPSTRSSASAASWAC